MSKATNKAVGGAAPEASQEVALMQNTMPDFLKNKTEVRGSENVTADDLTIPRLEVVQALSPCRKKGDPAYIEGAEEGDLYNSVTREIYGTHVGIIPVFFRKEFLIWKDRKAGGGFRGAFPTKQEAEAEINTLEDKDQCEAIDTAQHFCLLMSPKGGKIEEVVLSMSRSKMKVSKRLNSLIRLNGGDSFSRAYSVKSVVEKNANNQDYWNFTIATAGFPTQSLYERAEELYNTIKTSRVVVDSTFDNVDTESEEKEY